MDIAASFRNALIDLDVPLVRKLWAFVSPHMAQPRSAEDALIALHMARTTAESVPLNLRAYSHKWLTERSLPSRLPDHLRPSAERIYPIVVGAVGVIVGSKHDTVRENVRGAMEYAVLDCYANGDENPDIVKPQMMAAKEKELKALYGFRKR